MKQAELKKYLDQKIVAARTRHNRARTSSSRKLAVVRMDAFQEVREAVFGEKLAKDKP